MALINEPRVCFWGHSPIRAAVFIHRLCSLSLGPSLAPFLSRRVSVSITYYLFDGGTVTKLKIDERNIYTPHLYPN